MDMIGFLRVMQPSIMAGLWVLAVTAVLYMLIRLVLSWGEFEEAESRLVKSWTHRSVALITALTLAVLFFNAVFIASTDRMSRSDADKAKSGVYDQMKNLEKRTQ